MDDLMGEKVYATYGNYFPLLLKFIDAVDDLSIQVHPDDEYAAEHEKSLGKTEMWYVLPSSKEASIYLGWNKPMDVTTIHRAIEDTSLTQYLHQYAVKSGDVAYIPAGTVHAMKRNTIVAEIQENSDITYRLYDYNRVGKDGCLRPLKLNQALEVLNYESAPANVLKHPEIDEKGVSPLCQTPFFTSNRLVITQAVTRDYRSLDSFVAFMCIEGQATIEALDSDSPDKQVCIQKGEAVLIPAMLRDIMIQPNGECQLIEIYM
jgi:mannose-6-phosphate isomerase